MVISKLRAASEASCRIPFVSAEQAYPDEGRGVSFHQSYEVEEGKPNEQCLRGWVDQFLDMYMFTRCDAVVAGMYSSFTQAAPLSYMLRKSRDQGASSPRHDDAHPHYFCDVGATGTRIDCASTLKGWLDAEPNMTWGNSNARKQARREEMHFPAIMRRDTDITKLSKGTAML